MHSISGRWVGHYFDSRVTRPGFQEGEDPHAFGIVAELEQNGDRLSGTMTDLVTGWETRWEEYLDDETTAEHRELIKQVLTIDPDAVSSSSLPEKSRLEGAVKGRAVQFTKLYLGTHSSETRFKGKVVSTTSVSHHRVEYSGTLVDDDTLEGSWVIWRQSWFGIKRTIDGEGTFLLRRE